MTAKEDAEKLIMEYRNASFNCKDCDMPWCDIKCTILSIEESKQCALIAVNRIIKAIRNTLPEVGEGKGHWYSVREEIKNYEIRSIQRHP
jgi:hypothetical protein